MHTEIVGVGRAQVDAFAPPRADIQTRNQAAHARSMGAATERVASLAELGPAFERARQADRTAVIVIDVDANGWTEPGGAWWEVAIPEVSSRAEIRAARAEYERARGNQRLLVTPPRGS